MRVVALHSNIRLHASNSLPLLFLGPVVQVAYTLCNSGGEPVLMIAFNTAHVSKVRPEHATSPVHLPMNLRGRTFPACWQRCFSQGAARLC